MTPDELARLRAEALDALPPTAELVCSTAPIRRYIAALESQVAALDGWRPVTATEPAEELLCEVLVIHEARRIPGRWMRNWSGKPPLFYRPLPEPPEEVKP